MTWSQHFVVHCHGKTGNSFVQFFLLSIHCVIILSCSVLQRVLCVFFVRICLSYYSNLSLLASFLLDKEKTSSCFGSQQLGAIWTQAPCVWNFHVPKITASEGNKQPLSCMWRKVDLESILPAATRSCSSSFFKCTSPLILYLFFRQLIIEQR